MFFFCSTLLQQYSSTWECFSDSAEENRDDTQIFISHACYKLPPDVLRCWPRQCNPIRMSDWRKLRWRGEQDGIGATTASQVPTRALETNVPAIVT
jgi:hypothetical protein